MENNSLGQLYERYMIIELDFEHQARNYKEMYFNEVNSEIEENN